MKHHLKDLYLENHKRVGTFHLVDLEHNGKDLIEHLTRISYIVIYEISTFIIKCHLISSLSTI